MGIIFSRKPRGILWEFSWFSQLFPTLVQRTVFLCIQWFILLDQILYFYPVGHKTQYCPFRQETKKFRQLINFKLSINIFVSQKFQIRIYNCKPGVNICHYSREITLIYMVTPGKFSAISITGRDKYPSLENCVCFQT